MDVANSHTRVNCSDPTLFTLPREGTKHYILQGALPQHANGHFPLEPFGGRGGGIHQNRSEGDGLFPCCVEDPYKT